MEEREPSSVPAGWLESLDVAEAEIERGELIPWDEFKRELDASRAQVAAKRAEARRKDRVAG